MVSMIKTCKSTSMDMHDSRFLKILKECELDPECMPPTIYVREWCLTPGELVWVRGELCLDVCSKKGNSWRVQEIFGHETPLLWKASSSPPSLVSDAMLS